MGNGHFNRAGRRSGGARNATIHLPAARTILIKLSRLLVDEHNRNEDVGLTREHLRNMVRAHGLDRRALVDVFIQALGSGYGDLQRKIAEVFADNVLEHACGESTGNPKISPTSPGRGLPSAASPVAPGAQSSAGREGGGR